MSEIDPVYIIETIGDLEHLARSLKGAPRIAVDVESDSFYTYHPKVCLLQLSSENQDFIVDPLAIRDISPLGPVFRDTKTEKVFHAAEYDIQCLKRDYGFEINNLFDTMAAARILGAHELGLAALILKYFGVKLSKKLQRADWGKRPLTHEHIEYARLDTHYLLALRDILYAQLLEKDRWPDAQDVFDRLVNMEPPEKTFDPEDFWRLPGARELSGRGRAILKEIYFYREKTAAAIDKSTFRVLPEALMVRLAHNPPEDLESMERVSGMTPYLFKHFGKELLEVIRHGLNQPPVDFPPERPFRPPPDVLTMRRFQALREWRKNKAESLEVDSIVILTTDEIRKLAQAPVQNSDASQWLSSLSERKRQLYGEELIRILGAPAPVKTRRKRRNKANIHSNPANRAPSA